MALKQFGSWFALLAALVLLPATVLAQDLEDDVHVYGFGSWSAGNSDPHPYLSGTGDGDTEYDNINFVLGVSANVGDKLEIFGQLFFEESDEGEEAEVEIASAQWSLSDNTKIRFGKSRMPFGIYTEIFDVGTLRPFFHLPQSIYGSTGFVAEAYSGVGLTGHSDTGAGWSFTYDLYGGGMSVEVSEPFEEAVEVEGEEEAEDDETGLEASAESDLENVLGFRLGVATPVDGLSFGFSAYAGQPESGGEAAEAAGTKSSWGDVQSLGFHVEYSSEQWVARAELGEHDESEFNTDGKYFELARRFGEHWQLAGRVESIQIKDFIGELPADAQSLLEHDEVALGVNYWFNPNFVVKLSYHQVDGKLFAHAEGDPTEGDSSTDLIMFGAQFSF